jgi:hypothetical protein
VIDKPQVSSPIVAIGLLIVAFCLSGSAVNPADIYLPQLNSKSADVRITALRQVQTSLDSRIPEAMLALLSDEGNSIRRLAARAIGSRWWQIPKDKADIYVNALAQNLRSESDFQDEKNMAERAIGLLTRRYDSKMFSRSPNGRWIIYERRGLPCLIDNLTDTEELLGWPRDQSVIELFMPASGNETLEGNTPNERYVSWHPHEEAVALEIWQTRRATAVWIWQHKYGLHKLNRSELIKLLQPKGAIDEPNPLSSEIKEWKGDDLLVSVGWGQQWGDNTVGSAVVAWNLQQHKWRKISQQYRRGGD